MPTVNEQIAAGNEYVKGRIFALEDDQVKRLFDAYLQAHTELNSTLSTMWAINGLGDAWTIQSRDMRQDLMDQIMARMQVLDQQAMESILADMVDGYRAENVGAAWMLDQAIPGRQAAMPLLPTEAIRAQLLAPFLGVTFVERFADKRAEFEGRLNRSLVQSQIQGESIFQAQQRIAAELGIDIGRRTKAARIAHRRDFFRTQMIARTEILRASNLGAIATYAANQDVLQGWEWSTARDERVCFPKNVNIATAWGNVPIQHIVPGDLVLTRKGYKEVIAISSREYSGAMTTIETATNAVTSTADHPFWTPGGWTRADMLNRGGILQTLGNQLIQIRRVVNFRLSDPNDAIAPFVNDGVPPGIPDSVMPISAINFKGDQPIRQQEINRKPGDREFLHIIPAETIKRFSHSFFEKVFTTKATITRKLTKLTIFVSRQRAELNTASPAFNNAWRAATYLRAIMPVKVLFGPEPLTAPLAVDVLSRSRPASPATNFIAGIVDSLNGKRLFANRANLSYGRRFVGGVVTLTAAILALLGSLLARHEIAAMLAGRPLVFYSGLVITILTAILTATLVRAGKLSFTMGTLFNIWHNYIIAFNDKPRKTSITVYDIQVADQPEFYANGILVHNCPICSPLDQTVFTFDNEPVDGGGVGLAQVPPPAHPQCRCAAVPKLIDTDLERRIVGQRQSFNQWAQERGLTRDVYGRAYDFNARKPPKMELK